MANCTWHGQWASRTALTAPAIGAPNVAHGVGLTVNPEAVKRTRPEFCIAGHHAPYRRDWSLWYDLVKHLASAAVERYSFAEVQKWSFEVWNELWGMPFPDEYMALYNASAKALKSVHPTLKVGGPATAVLQHVSDFVDACEADDIPYDFVSTHHYPTDSCPKGPQWDPDCFSNDVLRSRRSIPSTIPFYLTEYNVGCCLGYSGHDYSDRRRLHLP